MESQSHIKTYRFVQSPLNFNEILVGLKNNSLTNFNFLDIYTLDKISFPDVAEINYLLVLTDGKMAIAVAKSIEVWDLKQTKKLQSFTCPSPVQCMLQLASGDLIVGLDNVNQKQSTLIHLNLSTQKITSLKGHTHKVISLLLLKDGRFVSGADDGVIKIWQQKKQTFRSQTLTQGLSAIKALGQKDDTCLVVLIDNYGYVACDLNSGQLTDIKTVQENATLFKSYNYINFYDDILSTNTYSLLKVWYNRFNPQANYAWINKDPHDWKINNEHCLIEVQQGELIGAYQNTIIRMRLLPHLIRSSEINQLLEAIKNNRSLEKINLAGLTLTGQDVLQAKLHTILIEHPTLKQIDLRQVLLSHAEQVALQHALTEAVIKRTLYLTDAIINLGGDLAAQVNCLAKSQPEKYQAITKLCKSILHRLSSEQEISIKEQTCLNNFLALALLKNKAFIEVDDQIILKNTFRVQLYLTLERHVTWKTTLAAIKNYAKQASTEAEIEILAFLDSCITLTLSQTLSTPINNKYMPSEVQKKSQQTSKLSVVNQEPFVASSTTNLPTQHISVKLALDKFPVSDLRTLIKTIQHFSVDKILSKVEVGQTTLPAYKQWLLDCIFGSESSTLKNVIQSNLNVPTVTQLLRTTFSKTTIFSSFFSHLIKGKLPTVQALLGEWQHPMEAFNQLKRYWDSCSAFLATPKVLAFHLLQDENLYQFFTSEEDDLLRQYLINICCAARIPGLDEALMTDMFQAVGQGQTLIQNLLKEYPNKTLEELLILSLEDQNHFKVLFMHINNIVQAIPKFNLVIKAYLEPSIKPLHYLAFPLWQRLFHRLNQMSQSQKKVEVAKLLITESETTRFGPFLATPLTHYLNNKNLEHIVFSSLSSLSKEELLINCHFKHLYFKAFTFQQVTFKDFDFSHCEFEACNFLSIRFIGQITVTQMKLDFASAKTFLPALEAAILNQQAEVIGEIILTQENGEVLSIPAVLEPNISKDSISGKLIKQTAVKPKSYVPVFEDNITSSQSEHIPFSSTGFESSPDQSHSAANPQTENFYSRTLGGLGHYVTGAKLVGARLLSSVRPLVSAPISVIEKTEKLLRQRYTESVKSTVNAVMSEDNQEKIALGEMNQQLLNLKQSLQDDINQLRQEITALKDQQQSQKLIIEEVDHEQIQQNGEMLSLQDKLVAVQQQLAQVEQQQQFVSSHIQQKIEFRRRVEEFLKTHPSQVTAYYETMLSQLSGTLLALFLLSNSSSLIEAGDSKLLTMAAKGSKKSSALETSQMAVGYLVQIAKKAPHLLMKATNLLQKGINVVSKISAGIPVIAAVANVAAWGMKKGIKYYEKQKLVETHQQLQHSQEDRVALTPKILERMAYRIAFRITHSYHESILKLTEKGAREFASQSVTRIMVGLLNGLFEQYLEQGFESAAMAVLRLYTLSPQRKRLLDIPIPFTIHKIADSPYLENQLHEYSGLCYQDETGNVQYYHNIQAKNDWADQLGYVWIDEHEWKTIFKAYVKIRLTHDEKNKVSAVTNISSVTKEPVSTFTGNKSASSMLPNTSTTEKTLAKTQRELKALQKNYTELTQAVIELQQQNQLLATTLNAVLESAKQMDNTTKSYSQSTYKPADLFVKQIGKIKAIKTASLTSLNPTSPFWQRAAKENSQSNNLEKEIKQALNKWEQTEFVKQSEKNSSTSQQLQQCVQTFGFTCQNVVGDGNCFFYAALDQAQLQNITPLIEFEPQEIRQQIIQHILEYHEHYEEFTADESFADYILRLIKEGESADHLFITAFCQVFQVNVVIIRSNNVNKEGITIIKINEASPILYFGYEVPDDFETRENTGHYQSLHGIPNESLREHVLQASVTEMIILSEINKIKSYHSKLNKA